MPCILLIDDHAIMLDGLRMVLESAFEHAQILTANSINAALQLDADPEVILLDIKLSGINGLDGLALIQRQWPQAKIAMLSSQDDAETRQQATRRGAHCFISKAESAAQIVAIVRQLRGGLSAAVSGTESAAVRTAAQPQPKYLTPRQCEVLELLSTGLTNKAIAKRLGLSENTVRRHLQDIFSYFGAATRTEAIFAARNQGVVN